ncbi:MULTISPECIES: ferrochelatase [unclassified Spirosoma]|uniref:ferrochelatase n=1 Tax=unclassified Spirosoma TaxID=2621999 RepID=UPI000961B3C7|nr:MULTISPECIES: ferrochelatase [unclassified Spirosoma]MBN8825347.1 ferrochelatase [Spirosoma sp.]OJW77483.1 MAG: ferrochelatase [Spirosoma sp. 48-14]
MNLSVDSSPALIRKSVGKTGVLLVNLGTPDSPSVPDVRKYLREFLMDGRVIDIPFASRFMLVNGIIAPFRAPKSAKVYKELWTESGSPLKYYGQIVERELQKELGTEYVVKLAMRYQNPSIEAGLKEFQQLGLSELIVIPFFPQYASATTGSIYELVMDLVKRWEVIPAIRFVNRFLEHPKFIEGFAQIARKYMEAYDYDYFLFSYHGLPERQIYKGDITKRICQLGECCNTLHALNQHCYRAQCFETTRLIVKALGIPEGRYTTSFQSRLGKDPWIQPYTDDIIKGLPGKGIKSVLAFSPAFVADCLETTIEVGVEYKELFEQSGGQHWQLVESLNDSPIWIETLVDLVKTA